jgi:hypothetical protein
VSCCDVVREHDAKRLLEAVELLGLISARRRTALQGENFGTASIDDVTECAAYPLTIDESRVPGERVREISGPNWPNALYGNTEGARLAGDETPGEGGGGSRILVGSGVAQAPGDARDSGL